MKVKQRPEDFQVEELTSALPGKDGRFAFYRLDKTGWTTPDAFAAVRRRWQIDLHRLSYGGLKDRHATTTQFFTILHGPPRNLSHERIAISYLGQRAEPYTAHDISANRFTITLRALPASAVPAMVAAIQEVSQVGFPNYFDDQRFGSVSAPPEFVAKEMVFGRFERALWLALAAPYAFDRAAERDEKQILRSNWKEWPQAKTKLPRGHARSLVDYLVTHPTDFKGAVARLRPDLQGLYLSAYQSHLWNQLLSAWLIDRVGRENLGLIDLKLGPAPVPLRMTEEQRGNWETLVLPLPSARMKAAVPAELKPLLDQVLSGEGLTLEELKIKGLQKPFFSKGDRPACIKPTNVLSEEGVDELQTSKRKLILKFDLARGCYATMLIKRVSSPITSPAPGP